MQESFFVRHEKHGEMCRVGAYFLVDLYQQDFAIRVSGNASDALGSLAACYLSGSLLHTSYDAKRLDGGAVFRYFRIGFQNRDQDQAC
jgi:hypothetical protein